MHLCLRFSIRLAFEVKGCILNVYLIMGRCKLPRECAICNRTFATHSILKRHKATQHIPPVENLSTTAPAENIPTSVKDLENSSSSLDYHLKEVNKILKKQREAKLATSIKPKKQSRNPIHLGTIIHIVKTIRVLPQ